MEARESIDVAAIGIPGMPETGLGHVIKEAASFLVTNRLDGGISPSGDLQDMLGCLGLDAELDAQSIFPGDVLLEG